MPGKKAIYEKENDMAKINPVALSAPGLLLKEN